jgi:hypothetical protein
MAVLSSTAEVAAAQHLPHTLVPQPVFQGSVAPSSLPPVTVHWQKYESLDPAQAAVPACDANSHVSVSEVSLVLECMTPIDSEYVECLIRASAVCLPASSPALVRAQCGCHWLENLSDADASEGVFDRVLSSGQHALSAPHLHLSPSFSLRVPRGVPYLSKLIAAEKGLANTNSGIKMRPLFGFSEPSITEKPSLMKNSYGRSQLRSVNSTPVLS